MIRRGAGFGFVGLASEFDALDDPGLAVEAAPGLAGAVTSLKTIASAVLWEDIPCCERRSVAKTLSMGLVVRMCCQCSAVVERQQRLPVLGQAVDRLRTWLGIWRRRCPAFSASARPDAIQIWCRSCFAFRCRDFDQDVGGLVETILGKISSSASRTREPRLRSPVPG